MGTTVAQWLRCCATSRKVAGSIPAGDIGIFHWHKILPIALWAWGRLRLYEKWVPGVFPGGKSGRCIRLATLPPSCAVVIVSGNLSFLEPSGPLQACNGTALPLPYVLLNTGLSNTAKISHNAAYLPTSQVYVTHYFLERSPHYNPPSLPQVRFNFQGAGG